MCGIAGKVFTDTNKRVSSELLKNMATAMTHRGPDDEGLFQDGPAGFAFRRLAIIDLSEKGHQPMQGQNGDITVILNGEIYNYREIRKEMEREGYSFESESDTEVVIYLYEKYGERCLEYLRGMFAIAIWDKPKQKLILIRDRVGQKPLKYFYDGTQLVFGSCIRSILKDDSVKREIDPEAIEAYLHFGFVPHPLTGFKGIQKLPPAHFLVFEKGKIRMERYWELHYSPKSTLSFEEAGEQFLAKFTEAVRLRMISDVPLGVFLSGGMDSSAVTAVMSQLSDQPINTFSIGFKEEKFNELPLARQVSKTFGTNHQEFIVEPHALNILPQLIDHYEEPYADSSAIPSFYLAQMTQKHVTVALNGDGGDESLLGYRMYKYFQFSLKYGMIPKSLQRLLAGSVSPFLGIRPSLFTFRLKRFLQSSHKPSHERYLSYTSHFSPNEIRGGQFNGTQLVESKFAGFKGEDPMDQLMWVDISHRLTDDLLVKVDVATMAYGLEGRSPFLDHKLMEFLAQLPADYKNEKRILKSIFKNELPEGVVKGKRGFEIPIGEWFRGPMKEFLQDALLSPNAKLHDYYDRAQTEKLINEHLNTDLDHSQRLWTLLMLEQWLQTF